MMYQNLVYVDRNHFATISLNRPGQYNALSLHMLEELSSCLFQISLNTSLKVLILDGGESLAFCSGADLKSIPDSDDLGAILIKHYAPVIQGIRNLKIPVICRLQGPAVGAGMALALACDMILADEKAYFAAKFVQVGLIPDAGTMYFLNECLGAKKAFELCASGRNIYMKEALELGLINEVHESKNLGLAVESWVSVFCQSPSIAIAQIKSLLQRSRGKNLDEVILMEAEAQTICGKSNDFREGVSAFKENRKPKFEGR
ncbi:MAG: enoyl-CoA hydratase/isomerase family protein [Leadbetterella sp.]